MGDPLGYLYVALGGVVFLHLWWQWDTVPSSRRRGSGVFGLSLIYGGALYATGTTRSPVAIAILGALTVVLVYYAVVTGRRGETWWHEKGFV